MRPQCIALVAIGAVLTCAAACCGSPATSAAASGEVKGIDLAERYPTKLEGGDYDPAHARE